MATAERTIGIRRPLHQVLRFLSDGRTAAQWRAGELEILEAGPAGPSPSVSFRARDGRVVVDGTFALEAMGEATILTCALRGAVPGWRGLLLPGAADVVLAAELRALDQLQDLLER